MSKSFLPPQAFTSQEVTRAMKWLEGQPNHIKAMAKNKDALMSLYKQALVYKDEFYDRYPPVSEEKFRADLNNLANQLSNFSETEKQEPYMNIQTPEDQKILTNSQASTNDGNSSKRLESEKIKFSLERERSFTDSLNLDKHLDPLTYQRILDCKKRFNLSSDEEALRMMVSLAFENIQKL